MNLLSAYVTINQSLLFLPPWVRRQKPSVPAHMPSSEGCTVSSAFQECFRAWWSALSQSPIELEMWPRSSWGFFLDRFIKGESKVRERYFLLMTDTDIDFTSGDCSAQALSHHGRESGLVTWMGMRTAVWGGSGARARRPKTNCSRRQLRVGTLEPLSDSVCLSVK